MIFNVSIPVEKAADAAVTLSWVIRVFLTQVCQLYEHGAPRRIEAYSIANQMLDSAYENCNINGKEHEAIQDRLATIYKNIFP